MRLTGFRRATAEESTRGHARAGGYAVSGARVGIGPRLKGNQYGRLPPMADLPSARNTEPSRKASRHGVAIFLPYG